MFGGVDPELSFLGGGGGGGVINDTSWSNNNTNSAVAYALNAESKTQLQKKLSFHTRKVDELRRSNASPEQIGKEVKSLQEVELMYKSQFLKDVKKKFRSRSTRTRPTNLSTGTVTSSVCVVYIRQTKKRIKCLSMGFIYKKISGLSADKQICNLNNYLEFFAQC